MKSLSDRLRDCRGIRAVDPDCHCEEAAEAIDQAHRAFLLFEAYENTKPTRGGKNCPKQLLLKAFREAKDSWLKDKR
jgi:hypothetical protein